MDFFNQAKDTYFNRPQDDDTDDDETDLKTAAKYAAVNTDNDHDDKNYFKNILGELNGKKGDLEQEDIDEEDAITSHRSIFDPSTPTPSHTSSSSLGSAAALQALKLFNSSSNAPNPSDTAKSQNAFVGLAMAQAAKLFDKQSAEGTVSSGNDKNAAVLKAGELALKMYLKGNKGGSSTAGFGGLGAGLVGAYLSGNDNKAGGSGLGGLLNAAVSAQGGGAGKQGGGGGGGGSSGLLGNAVGKLF
ncbi:hypothetical protein QBC43DRAFT_282695 [Cladorrhinum sp. PSN259]|nr:hypothetical protein QBC43DRAFT_282695 [Cladorrhinum sp. PSN259]